MAEGDQDSGGVNMKISKNTRRHLDTALLLMESVEESLKKYPGVRYPYLLRKEDSVESVHRRLIQIRQEQLVK